MGRVLADAAAHAHAPVVLHALRTNHYLGVDAETGGGVPCVRNNNRRVSINLQNGVRDVATNVVEVVMNSFGSKGSDGSFHVVCFVVDGEVEATLQVGGAKRVITGNAGTR